MGILLGLLQGLLGFAGGGLSGIFGLITRIFQSGTQAAMQFHQEGVAAARDLGLNLKQSQAYTQTLAKQKGDRHRHTDKQAN